MIRATLILFLILSQQVLMEETSKEAPAFSAEEVAVIHSSDTLLRVLTIEDPHDCAILRASSTDISTEDLTSEECARLVRLMVATVTHPSQDGVGIAAPQIGINRRIVAVQRFDKEISNPDGTVDYPFEVYPNIRIISMSDSLTPGPEGCLSVPNRRGEVLRSQEIVIEYADLSKLNEENYMVRDTVKGFTAVIFQHEIDHLDGVLYIDRL